MEEVTARLKASVEASADNTRRIKGKTLIGMYGFHNLTDAHRQTIQHYFDRNGLDLSKPSDRFPPLPTSETPKAWEREDWVILGLSAPLPPTAEPTPLPDARWYSRLADIELLTEREVELHFVSPLFHQLGYIDRQELPGLRIPVKEGSRAKWLILDLLYFADGMRTLETGNPLVLVETKGPQGSLQLAQRQAMSYAYWVKPAYYAVANPEEMTVFRFRGHVKDQQVATLRRTHIAEDFENLREFLSPQAALLAKEANERLWAGSSSPGHPV